MLPLPGMGLVAHAITCMQSRKALRAFASLKDHRSRTEVPCPHNPVKAMHPSSYDLKISGVEAVTTKIGNRKYAGLSTQALQRNRNSRGQRSRRNSQLRYFRVRGEKEAKPIYHKAPHPLSFSFSYLSVDILFSLSSNPAVGSCGRRN